MSEYARVYHSVMDDPKFDGIREDMRLFGSWTMLLVVADMAYPAPAFVPPTVPKGAFARLVACGLVDELPAHRFRIHGLQTEREQRTEAARAAGLASARSRAVQQPLNERSAGVRTPVELAKQSKAEQEQSTARDGLAHITTYVDDVWASATGRTILGSGAFAADYIDDAVRRHGVSVVSGTILAARRGFTVIPTPQQLAVAVRGRLDPLPDSKKAAAVESEQRIAAASDKSVLATLRRNHEVGGHFEERHPRCPDCQEAA